MSPQDRIIVALDVPSLNEALPLVEKLSPYVGCFKVGLQLLTSEGAPQVVHRIHEAGGKVFFDGKFDDIPNTVKGASEAVAKLGVKMFDVHACCGPESMRAAASVKGNSLLLAVTVLTSFDDDGTRQIFGASPEEKVIHFAREAAGSGADGIICSPKDLERLNQDERLRSLRKITPGVRPSWADANDQRRTLTPKAAIQAGATELVIGRPILHPPSHIAGPVEAAKRIAGEME